MSWFQSVFSGTGGSVNINGDVYQGQNISISNGVVTVDGEVQNKYSQQKIEVSISGSVEQVTTSSGNVTVVGNVTHVGTISGDVDCGHVLGSVETVSGDVDCNDIAGRVRTVSGNIRQR